MATAGYGMKFGKGYLGGGKPMEQEPEGEAGHEMEEAGESHHAAIHEHLRNMHEMTGKAHSHVEHHGGGKHTSHHVDHEGNVSGPHEHASTEEMAQHMDGMEGGSEEHEPEMMG